MPRNSVANIAIPKIVAPVNALVSTTFSTPVANPLVSSNASRAPSQ